MNAEPAYESCCIDVDCTYLLLAHPCLLPTSCSHDDVLPMRPKTALMRILTEEGSKYRLQVKYHTSLVAWQ